jgi:hypothetical protein
MPEVVTTISLASTMVKRVQSFSRDVLLSRLCSKTPLEKLCTESHPIYFSALLWYLMYKEIAMLGVQARYVLAQE